MLTAEIGDTITVRLPVCERPDAGFVGVKGPITGRIWHISQELITEVTPKPFLPRKGDRIKCKLNDLEYEVCLTIEDTWAVVRLVGSKLKRAPTVMLLSHLEPVD